MTETSASAERILVVDDEPDIVALVAYHLAKSGYSVSTATSGPEGLAVAQRDKPSLIVLDLMLPGLSGLEVMEELRGDSATARIAVLMLTARREESDRIKGLTLGADDYLTKPFSPQELVLRVAAILRRVKAGHEDTGDVKQVGPLRIDSTAHRVTVDGREIDLTPTEFKLLLLLAERKGRVQPRNLLLEIVWEAAPDIQTQTHCCMRLSMPFWAPSARGTSAYIFRIAIRNGKTRRALTCSRALCGWRMSADLKS